MYSNRHLAPRGSSRSLVILSYLSTHVPTIAQTWLGFFISFPTTYVRALHHQSRRRFYRSLLVVDLPNDAACSNNRSLPSTVNLSGIYRHMTYPRVFPLSQYPLICHLLAHQPKDWLAVDALYTDCWWATQDIRLQDNGASVAQVICDGTAKVVGDGSYLPSTQ